MWGSLEQNAGDEANLGEKMENLVVSLWYYGDLGTATEKEALSTGNRPG